MSRASRVESISDGGAGAGYAMISGVPHLDSQMLLAGLDEVRRSPTDAGEVRLVVRRPQPGRREVVAAATLDTVAGLVGDTWLSRGSRHTPDGSADAEAQVTVMNIRAAALVAGGDSDRVPLAGDQLYVDFDISVDNLPSGSLLAVGDVVLRVSAKPHTGCAKFVERFGADAMRFVNSPTGRRLRLRGMNTRVVTPGTIRVGDAVTKAIAAVEDAG